MRIITQREAEKGYEDFLDDIYGEVEIAGLKYSTSNALRLVDPIAYRCGVNDWTDGEGLEIE
jgi:hypothetical protein